MYKDIDESWDYIPSWQTEYDDDDFHFTATVLAGEASDELPGLFDGRIKRDGGRPVTLAELLSCLSEAHGDAEERRLRESARVEHALEVKKAIANVKGRVHHCLGYTSDAAEDSLRLALSAPRNI